MAGYAELHCISNFTFLRGASHPRELVERAHALGYRALALTDECSVSGVVRAHVAAKDVGLHLIIGSEFTLESGERLVLLAIDREGYRQLTRLITLARRSSSKGHYRLDRDDLAGALLDHCLALALCDPTPAPPDAMRLRYETLAALARTLKTFMPGRLWLTLEQPGYGTDHLHRQHLETLSQQLAIPLVATGNVHMHSREQQMLQDTLTAIRHQQPVFAIKHCLSPNAERHLRSLKLLTSTYRAALLNESVAIAEQIGRAHV